MPSQTDWDKLKTAPIDDAEDDFDMDWASAELVVPEPKKMISIRLDQDVIDFFRSEGRGYQTRMNAVLRAYMDAREKVG